jgi:hypothetical protein
MNGLLTSRTSRRARSSLALGILSIAAPIVLSIPAIVVALVALRDIRRSHGKLQGTWLAWSGLTAAFGSLALFPVTISMLTPLAGRLQEASSRSACLGQLRDLGRAMHLHAVEHGGRFPARARFDDLGKPVLSWRVALLPYLGHEHLHQKFALEQPWDGETNRRLLERMPRVYAHPGRPDAEPGHTYFVAPIARETIWDHRDGFPLDDFPRDRPASCWLAVVEAKAPVPWTKPDDLTIDPVDPAAELGGAFRKGFVVLLADGSVRFLTTQHAADQLRVWLGGEP